MYVRDHVDPVIVTMARARGHMVRFTPPHHSDLQPIETVWAIVKGEVGHHYTSATTFKEIRDRLEMAFARLQVSWFPSVLTLTSSTSQQAQHSSPALASVLNAVRRPTASIQLSSRCIRSRISQSHFFTTVLGKYRGTKDLTSGILAD